MKRNLVKTLGIPIVAMLILSLLPLSIVPVQAGANGDIYVDPPRIIYDTSNGTVCNRFNITVRVRNIIVPVFAWQVCVNYRTCYINVTQWWEPKWDPAYVFDNRGTLPVPTPPNVAFSVGPPPDYNDTATVSSALFPATPPGFTGNGLLCIIEFHICSIPAKGETFSCDLNINTDATFLLDEAGAAISQINKINGYYEMRWKEPPKPYQKIQPLDPGLEGVTLTDNTIRFDEWHTWNCTDFDVEVKIMNYYAAWGMTNATVWVDYNSTLLDIIGGELNVTINTADWPGPNEIYLWHDPSCTDWIKIIVRGFIGTEDGGQPVLVATIRFHIIGQGHSPPDYDDRSVLSINCTIWDHVREIPQDPAQPGLVLVARRKPAPPAWIEVDPSYIELGPEPCIGQVFCVNIKVINMHPAWNTIAYQFKLKYNSEYLSNVSITEGPWLTDPRWNWYGTLFIAFWEDFPFTHAVVGGILMPNPADGWDQPPAQAPGPDVPDLVPPVDPTMATLCFAVKKQVYPEVLISELGIFDFDSPGSAHFVTKTGDYAGVDLTKFVNGTVVIRGDYMPGRVIDVYTQYPDGFNGIGPHRPSDMFCPQKLVILCAKVTYNYWPVQKKIVGFEIQDWTGYIWAKLTAVTDENGIACVEYRLPWPCEDPESLFGVWKITATVDIACIVVNDTLEFHYDYCVRFHKVIIEGGVQDEGKFFNHCQWVGITVAIKSHAQRWIPVLIVVVIKDELGVPIGIAMILVWIGGAKWCSYTYVIVKLWIHIPKFAFAGKATIHINLFDKDPTEGGFAYCPEFEPTPGIWIQPY